MTHRQVQADETLIVGNGPSCGLQLHGSEVDPLHCMISLQGERIRVYDWNTSSGTCVNGRRIEGEELIAPGDVIEIGSVRIRTSIGAPMAEAPEPTAEPCREATSSGATTGRDALADEPSLSESTTPDSVEANSFDAQSPASEPPPIESLTREFPATESSRRFDAGDPIDSVADLDDAEAMSLSEEFDFGSAPSSRDDGSAGTPMDVLDDFLDDAAELVSRKPAYSLDPDLHDDTIELLKSEISFLQTELAERDAAIREYEQLVEAPREDDAFEAADPEVDVEALVTRLEELLDELARSDERLSAMSELLRAAEDANEAEVEQRNQIEAWVAEIERRFQERESEWQAEREALEKKLAEVASQRDRIEQQLGQTGGGPSDQKLEAHLKKLRQENTQLRSALEETRNQARTLSERLDEVNSRDDASRQQDAIDEALREERLQLAQERASLTRERAELAKLEEQLQRDRETMGAEGNAADQRIRAFREHLKEIHEKEPGPSEERRALLPAGEAVAQAGRTSAGHGLIAVTRRSSVGCESGLSGIRNGKHRTVPEPDGECPVSRGRAGCAG